MKVARTMLVVVFIASAALVTSSAAKTTHRTGSVPAQVALDWNTNAVATIRAATTTVDGPSRPLYEIKSGRSGPEDGNAHGGVLAQRALSRHGRA